MKGTIKWYNSFKGYGFIEGEDGTDVFVHRTAIPTDISLYEGDSVEYEIEESEKGNRAINIKKLKKAS
jgi:CspA family cold shock protein